MSVVRQSKKEKDEQGGAHRGEEQFLFEEGKKEMTDEQKAILGDHEAAMRTIILDLCVGSASWSKH